jgi:hypothetical protein
LAGLPVEQEERGQQPAARFQHPRHLSHVVLKLFSEQIGKHGVCDHDVKSRVMVWEAKPSRAERAARVIDMIPDVGDMEGAALVLRHPVCLHPNHVLPPRIEAFVFSIPVVDNAQRNCQPPEVASDIQ